MQVLFFAGLKKYFQPAIEMPAHDTVASLLAALKAQQHEASELLDQSRFAQGDQILMLDSPIQAHEPIVVLPPSSGG
ncbi:MAG: MoaD/ThiS family protein [Cytophagaceae bacterium]|jgi:molybdopterin converting factor small subunit|nr:MoaD/ThiS family protein [Cytophagaceae bacterium]